METGKTGADLIYYLITGEPLSFAVLDCGPYSSLRRGLSGPYWQEGS
jgi:hypothetical protein